jgi:transposase-like protein
VFVPPFCPYPPCSHHRQPLPRFFLRLGSYHPKCRSHPVPRFRCRGCGRTFSRQTFRADYRQKKPYLNAPALYLMVSCVGLRQAARCLRVARRTVEHRFRWLAWHAAHYHQNRLRLARLRGPFQLDEMESFEANRYQPVTVPVLIHRETLFLVATAVGPLRRRGRLSPRQRQRRDQHESLHGRRPSRSLAAVRRVLQTLLTLTEPSSPVVLDSDHKPLYGPIGRSLFGSRFRWRRHSASQRRDRANPLFPINHTNARLRHYLARLRRRTWCVSKRGDALQQHLTIAALWGNYCRGITNRNGTTPAQALGITPKAYRVEEVLAWREDWGPWCAPALAA